MSRRSDGQSEEEDLRRSVPSGSRAHGVRANVLENFLAQIAGLRGIGRWNPSSSGSIEDIRARVGSDKAICALSGGVDSAVAATLVSRAIGEQLTCIFVDHGLLREGEVEEVLAAFRELLHLNVVAVDARERFLRKLKGVEDPERKRVIIGHEFIDVFEREAAKIPGVKHFVQGTLYPDVIESKTPAEQSRGEDQVAPQRRAVCPRKWAFRWSSRCARSSKTKCASSDERWACPRTSCAVSRFRAPVSPCASLATSRPSGWRSCARADAIVRDEIDAASLDPQPWQYFAVLTPVKSVGVMGDGRTYANLVAIRAITSEDGMTADWARLPHELLERISARIVNEVPGVNRIAYDITTKPPATVEWE